MKKQLKKIFTVFCFMYSLFVVFALQLNVNATKSDNGNGIWEPTYEEKINVMGMEHSSVWGVSSSNKEQHVNVLEMKTDGYSSKLVTWAVDNGKNYTRTTLDELAKDYEEKHPGWIVVGGINADQYTTGYGDNLAGGQSVFYPQTYYPLIMDNESRIPYTVAQNYSMHIGFANNGNENSFVSYSEIKGFVLTIIDENKQPIKSFTVDKINENPNYGETVVWSTYLSASKENSYITKDVKSENDIYIIDKPELAYMNSSVAYTNGINSFYGRGTITRTTKSTTLVDNQFAIETNNNELKEALEVGTRIIVDAEYVNDDLNMCESSAGYHSCHRYNNKDVELVHTDYDGKRYSRSIFGRKEDGTYVLITVDLATDPNDLNKRYTGMNFDECNALLKHYGVVEAYQQDGGGSVTSLYRGENGEFVISNYPRDGLRANMTGLLFVVRDPQLVIEESTYNSVTLKLDNSLSYLNSTIENVVVTYDGKEYPLVNNFVTIDGLDENTEYTFSFTYTVKSKQSSTSTDEIYKIKAKTTLFEGKKPEFEIKNITKNSFNIYMEPNDLVKNVQAVVNENIYIFNNNEVLINSLFNNTQYEIKLSYDLYDEVTTNTYHREETYFVTTTLYNLPTIIDFTYEPIKTNTRLTLQYEYLDEDGIVSNAYILFNSTKIDLTTKKGNETIRKIDLSNNIYKFTLHLVYLIDGKETEIVSDEIVVGNESYSEELYEINYNLDGGINDLDNPQNYKKGDTIILKDAAKEGHIFVGWYLDNQRITKISNLEKNITLVAKWEKQKYNIKYELDGGVNHSDNPSSYEYGDKILLKEPTKEGYTFVGWYQNNEKVSELTSGDYILIAKWQQETKQSGCNCKKSIALIVMCISTVTLLAVALNKKH